MFTLASRAAMAVPIMGGLYAKDKKDEADKKFSEELNDKINNLVWNKNNFFNLFAL